MVPVIASDNRHRIMFDACPQPMWAFDEQTLRFVDVNASAIATYGYSRDEFLAMDITQIRPPEEIPRVLDLIRGESQTVGLPHASRHRTKSGEIIEVEVVASRIELDGRRARLVVARDVSERRALEDQLRQAQKIETVGRLAGGVAHDFNNLLTAIIGHAELLSDYFAPADPRAVEIAGIRHAADLAAGLTRQLLAFSRKQVLQPAVLDVNDVVDKARLILRRLIGEHIDLVTEPGADLWRVKADPGQLEQILLNLAVNARDAMPEGGRITIATRNVHLTVPAARRRNVEPGDYVKLTVSDTGAGMDAHTRDHLFEPFFTTKDRGRGTGLGLATVYGIVKQSGGHTLVASEPGEGAEFSIFLPATTEPAADVRAERPGALRGSETVLVVEDDATVRSLVASVLERRGYRLLVAGSGQDALRLAENHASPIDLLITDVVMARMNGIAVAEAIRARRPETKVLFVSGYADDAVVRLGFTPSPETFLNKPFTPDALARKVRTVLDVQ
jgi:PAS domain S-box-containing protein